MTSKLPTLPTGWEWKKVSHIAFIKGGKRIPKGKKLLNQKTEYPYIRVTDFTDDGTIDIQNIQYIDKDIYDEIKNYTITCNDLYISIAGTIGKTGIIPEILDGANLTENAVKLVYKTDQISNKFVYLFTQSNSFKEQAGLATKVVAMPKLAISRLSEIQIPLPPIDEQKRLVALLDTLFAKIDRSIELTDENIAAADALLPSALNTIFGELGEKWEFIEFGNITNLQRGHNPPKKDFIYEPKEGYIRFIQIRDGSSDINACYVPITKKLHLVTKEDLLLVAYRHVGKVFKNMEGAFNVALCKVSNDNPDKLNTDYLYFVMQSCFVKDELLKYSERSLIPSMSVEHLKTIKIPLPPLDIQTQTVEYLDSIRTKVEILKHVQNDKIAKLKALKASILDRAFKGEL